MVLHQTRVVTSVYNYTSLKNNCVFPLPVPMMWLFLTCGKKKKPTDIHYIINVYDFFLYAVPLKVILLELLCMWLVMVQTGPFCPRAQSICFFTSPLSTGQSIYRLLHSPSHRSYLALQPQFKYWSSWLQFAFLGHLHMHINTGQLIYILLWMSRQPGTETAVWAALICYCMYSSLYTGTVHSVMDLPLQLAKILL